MKETCTVTGVLSKVRDGRAALLDLTSERVEALLNIDTCLGGGLHERHAEALREIAPLDGGHLYL